MPTATARTPTIPSGARTTRSRDWSRPPARLGSSVSAAQYEAADDDEGDALGDIPGLAEQEDGQAPCALPGLTVELVLEPSASAEHGQTHADAHDHQTGEAEHDAPERLGEHAGRGVPRRVPAATVADHEPDE